MGDDVFEHFRPTTIRIIMALIGVATLIGNCLLAAILCYRCVTRRSTRDRRITLIISLAVADLFVGAHQVCFAFMDFPPNPKLYFCLTLLGTGLAPTVASTFHILAIAVNRYLYVLHGMRYRAWVTTRATAAAILLSWLLGLIMGYVPFFGWVSQRFSGRCNLLEFLTVEYMLLLSIGCLLLPFLITSSMYIAICIKAYQQKQRDQLQHGMIANTGGFRMLLRLGAFRLLLLVVLSFLATWLPFEIFCILFAVMGKSPSESSWYTLLHDYSILLGYSNSCLNPIIYFFCNKPRSCKTLHTIFRPGISPKEPPLGTIRERTPSAITTSSGPSVSSTELISENSFSIGHI